MQRLYYHIGIRYFCISSIDECLRISPGTHLKTIGPISWYSLVVATCDNLIFSGFLRDIHAHAYISIVNHVYWFISLWFVYEYRYPKVPPRPGYRTVPRPGRRAATWTTTVPPSAWTARAVVTVRRRPAAGVVVPATVQQHSHVVSRSPPKYCSARWTPFRRWSRTTSCTGKNRNDRRARRCGSNSDEDDDDRPAIAHHHRPPPQPPIWVQQRRQHRSDPRRGFRRRGEYEVWYFRLSIHYNIIYINTYHYPRPLYAYINIFYITFK